MIREKVVFICTCAKCKHNWTTKDNDLPDVCSKCKTRKWNEDHKPEASPTVQPVQIAAELARFDGVQMNDAMARFLTKAVVEAPAVEIAPVVEDWRFTKDSPQFSDDGNVYRKQVLWPAGKRFRSVQVGESATGWDIIERFC